MKPNTVRGRKCLQQLASLPIEDRHHIIEIEGSIVNLSILNDPLA